MRHKEIMDIPGDWYYDVPRPVRLHFEIFYCQRSAIYYKSFPNFFAYIKCLKIMHQAISVLNILRGIYLQCTHFHKPNVLLSYQTHRGHAGH